MPQFDNGTDYLRDDSIDFYQVTRTLLKNRKPITIFLLLSLVTFGILFATYVNKTGNLNYTINTIKLSLEFPGISEHTYPDGSKFSPNDIISNDILRKLYSKYEVEKLGEMDQFIAAFSISYIGFIDPNAVIENKAKKDKAVDVIMPGQILTNNYKMVRISMSSIQFDPVEELSSETRAKILNDIPALWSQKFKKFYLKYDIINPLDMLNFEELSKKEYMVIHNTLSQFANEFLETSTRFKKAYPVSNFKTAEQGLTLNDVIYKIKNDVLRELDAWYSIPEAFGIFKNRKSARAYLQNRLHLHYADKKRLDQRYDALKMVLSKDKQSSGQAGLLPTADDSNRVMPGGSAAGAVPNLSAQIQTTGIYDRFFEMGLKSKNAEYLNSLTERLLDTVDDRSRVESEIVRIKRILEILQKDGENTALYGVPIKEAVKEIDAGLDPVITNFKKWIGTGVEVSREYYKEVSAGYGGIITVMAPVASFKATPPELNEWFNNLVVLPLLAMLVLFAAFCLFLIVRESFRTDAAAAEDTMEPQKDAAGGIKGIVEKI